MAKWAAEESKAATAKQTYINALQTEISAQQQLGSAWASAGQSARAMLDQINGTTGSPTDQIDYERGQVAQLYAAATGGGSAADRQKAAAALPQAIDALLKLDNQYNASGPATQADIAASKTELSTIANIADSEVSLAQQQVDKLTKQLDYLQGIDTNIKTLADAKSAYEATGGGSNPASVGQEQLKAFDTLAQSYSKQIAGLDPNSSAFAGITSSVAQSRDALIGSITDPAIAEQIGEKYYQGSLDPGANNLRARIYALGGEPHFATGGAFMVGDNGLGGGWGGVDSTLVRFRATPGERVGVWPPGFDGAAVNDNGGVIAAIRDHGAGSFNLLGELLAEVRGLRADNAALRAELAQWRHMGGGGDTYGRKFGT
jgi:hypothetical protein